MSFEPTSKGNPYNFVINQHFHTAHAIGKFHNNNDKLDVYIIESGKVEQKHKRSKIFCAKRNWDQKTETIIMHPIENKFHEEINNIKSYELRNHHAISEYFLLWRTRHHFHISRMDDIQLNGISDNSKLTKKQKETLENKGVIYSENNGVIPSRFMTGIQISRQIDMQWSGIKKFKWGLLEAKEGEFIVSDCYNKFMFIPISPTLAFCANYPDMIINKESISNVNIQSIEQSTNFYFARDLKKCPL